MAMKEHKEIKTLNEHLANYVKSDDEFMEGIMRGVRDCKEGRIRPWSEVKKRIGSLVVNGYSLHL